MSSVSFAEIETAADEEGYTEGSLKVPHEKCHRLDPLSLYMSCVV